MQLVCRDAALMTMRAAIAGKSADDIVALQARGALDGELSEDDFARAAAATPPSVAPEQLKRYEAWNEEFGCEPRAAPSPRPATTAARAALPDAPVADAPSDAALRPPEAALEAEAPPAVSDGAMADLD